MANIRKLPDKHIELIEPFLPKERGSSEASLPEEDAEQHSACSAELRPLGGHASPARQMQDRLQLFRHYFLSGVWDRILDVLARRKAKTCVSMIDGTFAGFHRISTAP